MNTNRNQLTPILLHFKSVLLAGWLAGWLLVNKESDIPAERFEK